MIGLATMHNELHARELLLVALCMDSLACSRCALGWLCWGGFDNDGIAPPETSGKFELADLMIEFVSGLEAG
jgi:hypothetical protein